MSDSALKDNNQNSSDSLITAKFKIPLADFTLDVDFKIPTKGITAIFGPSGSGKTTLLRAIAGLHKATSGYLQVGDAVWQSPTKFVPTHQRALAYVFQEASLFEHLSVADNLHFAVKRARRRGRSPNLNTAIEQLDIANLLSRKPTTLSGGERQRVAIARALASDPSVLLMDEPLASLDHARKQEILPLIETLHGSLDIPIIYVSHAQDEVARLADHLLLLQKGQIKGVGAIEQMLTDLDLPMAHDESAAAIIETTVHSHDDQYQLTQLAFGEQKFMVNRKPMQIGTQVRLRVAARDVSLTLQVQQDTSILNIFPARIEQIKSHGESQLMVKLSVGEVTLLSLLTRKSGDLLALKVGQQVYAQAKSAAVLA